MNQEINEIDITRGDDQRLVGDVREIRHVVRNYLKISATIRDHESDKGER